MKSLQARIAALLVAAIIGVVTLASLAATRVMQPPAPQATMEPVARQIHLALDLLGHGTGHDGTEPGRGAAPQADLHPEPAAGEILPRESDFLREALRRTGSPRDVVVTRVGERTALNASVRVSPENWRVFAIPDMSPPAGRWKVLAIWLALIVLGSAAISIHIARRLTRPLQLLEDAADRVGPDGTLDHVPETGSAEVQSAARALNRLSVQLKDAMESRMRLVAAAGHDLRTPMTRMRLRAEFIEDAGERAKWLSDLEELDLIADSAIRLVREEVGPDGREPLRLDRLLGQIAQELRATGHRVDMGALPEMTVMAGPIALKRALRNLIANAATHGGGAHVSLARDGAQAVVAIRDEGPGVPPELLARIFEPFFRVDQARRKSFPGAGLGLAIAREIVERNGGTITIANRVPQGLVQTCRLPVAG